MVLLEGVDAQFSPVSCNESVNCRTVVVPGRLSSLGKSCFPSLLPAKESSSLIPVSPWRAPEEGAFLFFSPSVL